MKKLLLIMLVLLGTVAYLQAQNDKMIKFKVGVTEPIGSYGSGYAKTGWNAGIESVYYLNDWFGLGGNFTYSYQNFDHEALNAIPMLEPYDEPVFVSNSYYDNWTFTMGPYFKYDITEQFSVQAKTQLGMLSIYHPDMFIVADFISGYGGDRLYLESHWQGDFAVNLGLGFQYLVTDNIGINLEGEYTNSSPNFAHWSSRYPSITLEDKRRVSFVNMNFGVSYYFW